MKRDTAIVFGKLLTAIAWADNEIHEEEIKQLKSWFNMQKELGQKDWFLIRLYLEYPLTKSEIEAVIDQITSIDFNDEERKTILAWVKKIIQADDVIDEREKALFNDIQKALESDPKSNTSTTPFNLLKKKLTPTQPQRPNSAIIRDRHLDDFWENPIFFRFYRSLQESDVFVSVDKETLRRVCYAASLLIMVAHADDKIHADEIVAMGKALNEFFQIPPVLSSAIIHSGSELDKDMLNTQRICRKFMEVISKADTQSFLAPLSEIVWADGKILPIEKKVFMDIAQNLRIPPDIIQKQIKVLKAIEENLEQNWEEETYRIKQEINQSKELQENQKENVMWPPKKDVS
jgi:uncharacterized tellurite resistance protein B-like protein